MVGDAMTLTGVSVSAKSRQCYDVNRCVCLHDAGKSRRRYDVNRCVCLHDAGKSRRRYDVCLSCYDVDH